MSSANQMIASDITEADFFILARQADIRMDRLREIYAVYGTLREMAGRVRSTLKSDGEPANGFVIVPHRAIEV